MVQRNSIIVNPKKLQFMILGKTPKQPITLNINQIKVEESEKVVLQGLTIDNRLTFKDHVDMLCSTVFLTLEKKQTAIQHIYKQPI